MTKNNAAEQDQVTIHILGSQVMWGVDDAHLRYSEDFADAANANIENGPVPVMPKPREPKMTAVESASNQNIVNLFKR